MENQKPATNQGLLDALESLGAALSVVSISVDMVREELQSVLSVLAANTEHESPAPQQETLNLDHIKTPRLFPVPGECESDLEPVEAPAIYLVESV